MYLNEWLFFSYVYMTEGLQGHTYYGYDNTYIKKWNFFFYQTNKHVWGFVKRVSFLMFTLYAQIYFLWSYQNENITNDF